MSRWQAKCTCGEKRGPVEANTKEEAVDLMLKHITDNPHSLQKHMTKKHSDKPDLSTEDHKANLLQSAVALKRRPFRAS